MPPLKSSVRRKSMGQYGYLIASIGIGAVALVVIYLSRSRHLFKSRDSRSWVSYLFLWPLIFDADASKRKGRLFTIREWFGWALAACIIFCGILISGRR